MPNFPLAAHRALLVGLLLSSVLVSCGGTRPANDPPPAGGGAGGAGEGDPPGVVRDTRSPIDRRRDAACDALGPRITACAVEDAQAQHAAGKITKDQLQKDTAAEVQAKNTEKFLEQCKVALSTRQVRVLEVCPAEETECGPLLDCLEHLNDTPK